jgi:hypothetical protein
MIRSPLRHRDASKRELRRVVAQGHPVQCAKGTIRCERKRRSRDQRGRSKSTATTNR